jgi:hypothetical protein
MLVATWVPSHVFKAPEDECTANLVSWAMPWADIALFLNSMLIFIYLLTGFLIVYQLSRTAKINRAERIAASRTVYYLAVGVLLMVLGLFFPHKPSLLTTLSLVCSRSGHVLS